MYTFNIYLMSWIRQENGTTKFWQTKSIERSTFSFHILHISAKKKETEMER